MSVKEKLNEAALVRMLENGKELCNRNLQKQ